MTDALLEVTGLRVQFGADPVLAVPSLRVSRGEFVALTGPSGSGKTTLLHILAGILKPSAGTVSWAGKDISALREGASDRWRREHCGLIFQDFHLIEQLTPIQNVILPATFSNLSVPAAVKTRAAELLNQLGIPEVTRSVTTLSRGERQRVAIARALLFDPPILLADEPTASLDQTAAEAIGLSLSGLAESGHTVIAVSHDPALIARAGRVVRLERGRIVGDTAQPAAGQPQASAVPA